MTRARAELSRQIKVRVESVLSLYQEVSELEGRVDARDELTSRSIQSTRAQLEGTRVEDTATDRGTLYALVCVERARALRVLNEVKRRVKVLAPRQASTAPNTSSEPRAAPLDNIKRDQRGKRDKREALRARAESALRELEAHLGSSQ